MVLSMTGFASAQGRAQGIELDVEVRSVNNRYLKCIVNMPEGWGQTEAEIERLIRSRLSRGTIMLRCG